jgi:hypothetical protein
MPKPLSFDRLDNGLSKEESAVERWKSREPDPVVQMSLRMHATVYDQFRALCKKERRTNGDMLEVLLKSYLASQKL